MNYIALGKGLRCIVLQAWMWLPLTAGATTITLNSGYLRGTNGATLTSANTGNASSNGGALLLLIASGSTNGTTFTAPAAGQFVGGNDVIVGFTNTSPANGGTQGSAATGFEFNNNGGTQTAAPATGQESINLLSNITAAVPNASAYLELRWYPNITLAQYQAGVTPVGGTYYGAYNPVISNPADASTTNLNPDGGQAWTLTTATNITLNFYTTDDSGSQPLAEGYANIMVPVPEPSVGILSGLALVVVVASRNVGRRLKVS